MKLSVYVDGLDVFLEEVQVVKEKAEELNKAVKRLNEIELDLKIKSAND